MSFYLLCHDSSIWHRVTLIPPCVTPIHQNQISYSWFYQQCLASLTIFFWGWLLINWSQWYLNKTIDVRYFCFWCFDPKSWWPIYWNEKDDLKACGTIWCDCSLCWYSCSIGCSKSRSRPKYCCLYTRCETSYMNLCPAVLTDAAQERLGQVQLWKLQIHHPKEQRVNGQVKKLMINNYKVIRLHWNWW